MTDNFIDCIVNFVDTLKNVVTAVVSYTAENTKFHLFPVNPTYAEQWERKSVRYIFWKIFQERKECILWLISLRLGKYCACL